MSYELTNEDKINVINGRLRNLEVSKYDLQLSIQEENSLVSPSTQIIANHQATIDALDSKIALLQVKLEELS